MLRKIRYKLVYNRSCRLNKRGEGLIEIECTQQKRRIYFTTHVYVKPENPAVVHTGKPAPAMIVIIADE